MSLENIFRGAKKRAGKVLAFASLLACLSCAIKPEQEPVSAPPMIAENAHVLTEELSSKISSLQSNKILLSNPLDTELNYGDILISDISEEVPQGILRKVIGVYSDHKTILTEPASLNEVVDNYSFDKLHSISPSSLRTSSLPKNISRASSELFDFSFDLENLVLYSDSYNNEVIANGNISFSSSFDINFDIEDFKLTQFSVKNITEDEVNLSVSASTFLSDFYKKVTIDELYFTPFTIAYIPTAPPIPIIVTPKLGINIELIGDVAPISMGLNQKAYIELGLSYSNESWSPIYVLDNKFEFQQPLLPQQAYFSVCPNEEFSLFIYDSLGPYANLEEYISFHSYSGGEWDLYSGIIGSAGVSMQVFGKTILDYNKTLIDYYKLLATGTLSSGPTPTPGVQKNLTLKSDSSWKDCYVSVSGLPGGSVSYYNSNSTNLEVLDLTNSSEDYLRESSLISFPTSLIPDNVSSAKLFLYGSGTTNYSSSPAIKIREVDNYWTEYSDWSAISHDGEYLGSSVVGSTGWYAWDITSAVQRWESGEVNYGLELYAAGNSSWANFNSSEYSDTSRRPYVEIEYYE